jgi:zinc ribbon protein
MNCKQCGNQLQENAKFCNKCGTPVIPAVIPPLDDDIAEKKKAEEEAKAMAIAEAALKAEEEAKAKEIAEATLKAEKEAKAKVIVAATFKAEKEAKAKVIAAATLKAEKEAKAKVIAQAPTKVEEEKPKKKNNRLVMTLLILLLSIIILGGGGLFAYNYITTAKIAAKVQKENEEKALAIAEAKKTAEEEAEAQRKAAEDAAIKAEKYFQDIKAANEKLRDDHQGVEKVHEELKQYAAIYSTDYRPILELVINRIYGEKHEEAFDLLKESAKVAIENGEAKKLLYELDREKNTSLYKLSTHAAKWNKVYRAVKENDVKILEEVDSDHH